MIWSYPHLTADRALFNVLWTLWIFTGSVLEERDLVAEFGDRYRDYQNKVPMLIPWRIVGWVDATVRFGPVGAHAAEVESIVDFWPGDDHRYFRVRVHDGAEFILRQDLKTGLWRMDFFRRDATKDT